MVDDVTFLKFSAWLRGTRAALSTIRAIPKLVDSVWDFSLAKLDSGVALGYFVAREAEVMHRGYCKLKDFAYACDFPASFFERLEEPSPIP